MTRESSSFDYEVYESILELNSSDAQLLQEARAIASKAYAPYSGFHVGAAALLDNDKILTGNNQENASFPVGLCAERVLLSVIASQFPDKGVRSIALSYQSSHGKDDHPISPCGICRQSLLEYEERNKSPIRLVMGGREGKVYILSSVRQLLPLSFSGGDLKTQP